MVDKKNSNLENVENLESEEKEAVEPQTEKAEKGVARKEMDELKSDVESTSQELKTAVTELRKSIVDIRSAVSEIENPFNLLRVISSEKDLKKLNSERLPPGVKSLALGKPENKSPVEEEKPEEKPSPFEEERPLEHPPLELQPPAELEPKIVPQPQGRLPKTGSGYLDWVWPLLDSGFSSDDILQLAKSYEFMGYLPAKSSEYIYSLAIACEKAKSKGFNKGQMLLNMYKAAMISEIKVSSGDVKELISIAEGRLKRGKVERTK